MGFCKQHVQNFQTCNRYQTDVVLGANRWDFVSKVFRIYNYSPSGRVGMKLLPHVMEKFLLHVMEMILTSSDG